ncbi:ABC transporter ATP-binding protein/permease [Ihubacter massiliensis]|uniref:ABC transporter ATP-binding protein/permease n=1 Tax=Hominibacterium faecale TaxID=2839743 RepID=A0A9J6QSK0_9FIRM|nr:MULTISPECIES: ABC transporter ATP-binding protein [Eubacteriales Family XIII. Incertae Sedis]MCO7121844.1 ABC transporter ATP-binding protein/permease [Ihubacter massiliensis]MCU7377611.1 ABC transporter ATP-binding protein/permease [Hominibacterium faecale]
MKALLRFLKPYKGICFFTLLVMLVDVAGALYIPTLVADMINIGVGSANMNLMIQKGILMLAAALISGAGTLLGSFLCARLSARIGRDIRNALYDKSLAFSAYDFEQFGTGSMITRTLNDVNIVQQAFVWTIQMVLPVPMMCVIGVIMAFSIDRFMGFLLIAMTAVVMIAAVFITRKASMIFEKLQAFLDRINVVLRENITGVRVIRAFNKEPYEEKRMRRSFEDYAESAIRANRLFFALESLAFFTMNICIVSILWLGGNRIGAGMMEIGDITALTEYALLILFYLIMAQMVIILLPRANVCLKRIHAVLSHHPEIRDGARVLQAPSPHPTEVVCRFRQAGFRFADAEEATLQGLDFALRRGETTAIIGSTGSGKSTIAKLLLRFHDVTEGAVLINEEDIRNMAQQDLRRHIAYVPQKAWLFSGTIADNLRYAKEQATEKEMNRALEIAQADFVHQLPGGLQTRVSQGGANFSGGQKQRLSIARALMKEADLYIFDDSFSALDFKTDANLRRALASAVTNSAVLIIAQRINTIVNADQILVLENGRIAGLGRHDELLQSCPIYQDIAKSQTKEEESNGKQS